MTGDYGGVVALILAILFAPPLCMVMVGFLIRKKHQKGKKVLFIMATVYLMISLGICGGMLV